MLDSTAVDDEIKLALFCLYEKLLSALCFLHQRKLDCLEIKTKMI